MRKDKKPRVAYQTAECENDTYDMKDREEKERIPEREIMNHWETRAQRPDVQSVMSARHTLEDNRRAAIELQDDIFDFLGDLTEDKIFELGVGIGRMTYELAQRAIEIVGIDISPTMLERARSNLREFENVKLYQGKITEADLRLPPKYFDLVFESIVLLHILNPEELRETARRMQDLSDRIFIVEHVYEGPDFPISKYSILRKPEEYVDLFNPYKLAKQKTHYCAGDKFMMMLFENLANEIVLSQP